MLVCRDLEKAKEKYGFITSKYSSRLKKNISSSREIFALIDKQTKEFYLYICEIEEDDEEYGINITDLDFLYDMIKDGILEKVEE